MEELPSTHPPQIQGKISRRGKLMTRRVYYAHNELWPRICTNHFDSTNCWSWCHFQSSFESFFLLIFFSNFLFSFFPCVVMFLVYSLSLPFFSLDSPFYFVICSFQFVLIVNCAPTLYVLFSFYYLRNTIWYLLFTPNNNCYL